MARSPQLIIGGEEAPKKKIPKKYHGLKSVKITDTTDTYIIHFIAHKLAFAEQAGKDQHPTLRIYEYKKTHMAKHYKVLLKIFV